MSNVFIRLISEFQDKGFKSANKSTLGLSRQFDNLKRSAARAFIAIAGISALKRSVQAFAKADQAVQGLNKSLDNLGLKYESLTAVQFLEDLEKATTVSKEQLFPAFRNLVNATLDVAQAQKILGSALDISAGTGSDLNTVVKALARAYNGNYTSLGKLQFAYSTAELEALGFSEALERLNQEFAGQAAANAETYQGKIDQLSLAVGDAKEAIGEGLVGAFETLGAGNYDKGLGLIQNAADLLAGSFKYLAKTMAIVKYTFTTNPFDKDTDQFIADVNRALQGRVDPAKQRALTRERAKYLKEEQAKTEKIRKDREKIAKLLEKEKNNQKIIAEAQKGFDLERIQIEAALKGKINDVEEYRLKLQRAILNENVDNVIKYTGLLKEAEAQAAELAQLLADLPEMAENPFTDWPAVIARIQYLLKELDWQIPIDVLFAEKGLKLDQDKMTVTKLERMDVNANNVFINGNVFGANGNIRTTPWGDYDINDPKDSLRVATLAYDDALKTESEALIALAEAEADVAAIDAMIAEFDAAMAEFEASQILYGVTPTTTVNVTVEGSVISEYDLAQTIINEQYQYQRSGGKLTFNQVAI